ncbi:cobalamin B12-binding domain-containing protein [Catenulispora sp. GAS73]|uniref:cobalamin B12-binding domain-containing protein n=1 Tax=Catenulispora sp. GAS73 TaxID=3156269 RepID=UPI003514A8CD
MAEPGLKVLIAGGASDAHTWNLVYLELLLQEAGHRTVNIGPCVSGDLLAAECRRHKPDLVAVGTVNGHGHRDGLEMIAALRADPALAGLPAVIGGKLDVAGVVDADEVARLIAAGYRAVFADGDTAAFLELLAALAGGRVPERAPERAR